MRTTSRAIPILLCLGCLSATSAVLAGDAPSPGDELRALMRDYGRASVGFRAATTDEERKAAVESLDQFAPRFVELAETHVRDAVAVDACVEAVRAMNAVDSLTMTTWEMSAGSFPVRRQDDAAARTVGLLLRAHLRSDRLAPVCERMTYGLRGEFEGFLWTVLGRNPNREVRAIACLALAGLLRTSAQKLDAARERPELAPRLAALFGGERFEELRRRGSAQLAREAESLLDRAVADYGDVKHPYGGTVGEKAKEELLEMRGLVAGAPAPDIEGEDQDGKRFKLSDYRGKVVLLDFWQEY